MGTFSGTSKLCYQARLLLPLAQVVRQGNYQSPALDGALAWIASMQDDARVSILTAHALLDLIASISSDPIGVRAAQVASSQSGSRLLGPHTCKKTTVRGSLEDAIRRMGTLSEASACTLELTHEHALVRLASRVGLPPIGEDYQTCGLLACLLARWPTELRECLVVWFRRKEPVELHEYRRLLGGARLHFGAHVSGFSFPKPLLDRALVSPRPAGRRGAYST